MTEQPPTPSFLDRPDGERLAYLKRAGHFPGLLWLGGFRSDMTGTKAEAVDRFAQATGHACVRFDYFAHGRSTGDFRKASISRFRDDALVVLDTLTEGPQILIGSSLGGWVALMTAEARPERVAALILIAPAPDFTERLLWPSLPRATQDTILREGECIIDAPEGPYPLTRGMIEDGRRHLLLDRTIAFSGPVRILQGDSDESVPWAHAFATATALASRDVVTTIVKGGDHRLSTPVDIARLEATIAACLRKGTPA